MPQSARPTEVLEWDSGRQRRVLDELAAEEPLEIRINGAPISVTMRTPGDDFELAAGFLVTEGIVAQREQIARIGFGRGADGEPSGNLVDVTLATGEPLDRHRLDRHFFASSSCGICGKASIDGVRARNIECLSEGFEVDPDMLTGLPDALRSN